MARKYLMSWEGEPAFRWTKFYKGQRYRVSCEELNAPLPTQEASWRLANEWWERKLLQLNAPSPEEMARNRYRIADLEEKIQQGRAAEAMRNNLLKPPSDQRDPNDLLNDGILPLDVPADLEAGLRGTGFISADEHFVNLEQKLKSPTPKERLLSLQAKKFLTLMECRHNRARLTFTHLQWCLNQALPLLPETIDELNSAAVSTFYQRLTETPHRPKTQFQIFQATKRFVYHLWEEELIELPRVLSAKNRFTFEVNPRPIKRYDLGELRQMLGVIYERLRLYALLGLNCGMTSVDIASIRWEEWQGGRITRKRTKTKRQKDVPTVCYPLWPETEELLRKYQSKHPELVLTTKNNTPLNRESKSGRVNAIKLLWNDDCREKPTIPLKAMRSIGATLLDSHKEYARCSTLYLGHSPKSMKDKHYSAPPQQLFDEAVSWLREQILGQQS